MQHVAIGHAECAQCRGFSAGDLLLQCLVRVQLDLLRWQVESVSELLTMCQTAERCLPLF